MCQTDAASYIEVDRKNGIPVKFKSFLAHSCNVLLEEEGNHTTRSGGFRGLSMSSQSSFSRPLYFPPLPSLGVKSNSCHVTVTAMLFFCFSLNADSDGSIVVPLLIPESERGHVGLEVVSDNAW